MQTINKYMCFQWDSILWPNRETHEGVMHLWHEWTYFWPTEWHYLACSAYTHVHVFVLSIFSVALLLGSFLFLQWSMWCSAICQIRNNLILTAVIARANVTIWDYETVLIPYKISSIPLVISVLNIPVRSHWHYKYTKLPIIFQTSH